MHCASCAGHIERATRKLDGVISSSVNVGTEVATIEYDETKLGYSELNSAITKYGYSLVAPIVSSSRESRTTSEYERETLKKEKFAELDTMRGNVRIVMPFVTLSFLYMVLDI